MKKSFALLSTLILLFIFSLMSVRLVETNLLSSNLNSLKYLHLQATIYMNSIKEFIITHTPEEIETFVTDWSDGRFIVKIVVDQNDNTLYYYSIETTDTNSHVRLSQKTIK